MSNKYIEPENYYDGYNKNIDDLKNRPEVVELDKLCYEVFVKNESGKKLLELFEKRFIVPGLVRIGDPTYKESVIFYEGFKEAFRMIKGSVAAFEQRIQSERMV